ncbi:MAG: hypothetical protein H7X97_02050 [Opitutaceae bacterium]|nr:hypothetical protein [Verrucomicrobiales bacterium]
MTRSAVSSAGVLVGFFLAFAIPATNAAEATAKAKARARPSMDLGPAVSFIFNNGAVNRALGRPDENLILKGLSIRMGTNAGLCFDTATQNYVAGWTGGFVDVSKSSIAQTAQGSSPVYPIGKKVFSLSPSANLIHQGRFKGHWIHGDHVVLRYDVNMIDILDLPGVEQVDGEPVFTRTLQIEAPTRPLRLLVAENQPVTLRDPTGRSRLETNAEHAVFLRLPESPAPYLVQVAIGPSSSKAVQPIIAPKDLILGGPARWPQPEITQGRLGSEPGAYVVDTLTIPETNRWNSWMRLSAMDFFSDGRCAVSTLSGDVWIVSGLDGSLGKLTWKRFAAGLYEPLGLKVVDDTVYVLGRDRVTRLLDLNGDSEADYYQSFNSDLDVYPTYHAFVFDLQTDTNGNFYFVADGNMVDPYLSKHGSILKLSKDGAILEEFARGFRAANGMSVGPNNEITCSDNQGFWTPSSKINWVKKGGFYGFVGDPRQPRYAEFSKDKAVTSFDPPLCWIPMNADNSSGGQIWVTSDQWGLPRGSLLHTSYGKCTLFSVMTQDVDGQMQGGVWQFPLKFSSGIMRGRFSPKDGQLYVCGLKGWQSVAQEDGALQRIRYTGKPMNMPVGLRTTASGIELRFSDALDAKSSVDVENFSIAQWNYRWATNYGSDSWSVADPQKKGEDTVEVKSAKLSADGKSLVLETQPLQPVMQMRVKYNLQTARGAPLKQEIYNTVNRAK